MAHVEYDVTHNGIAQSLEDRSFQVYADDNTIIKNYKNKPQDIIQSLKDDFNRFIPGDGVPKQKEKGGDFRIIIGRINNIVKVNNAIIIQSNDFNTSVPLDMFILNNIMLEIYDIIKVELVNDKITGIELNGEVIKGNNLVENNKVLDKKLEGKIEIKELENKYKDFGTPDLKQIKIIDSWSEDFRIKMKGVLIFKEEVTEIKIKNSKFTFDKKQLINESITWNNAQTAIEKLGGRRGLGIGESKLLFDYFYYGGEYKEFVEILNLTHTAYWLSYLTHEVYGRVFDCGDGLYGNSVRGAMIGVHYNVLCVHCTKNLD